METKSGSFIYLQSQKRIDPNDQDEYDKVNWQFLTKSVTVGIFCLYWARLYEIGKYKLTIPNRLMYYAIIAGVLNFYMQAPSIAHAFYQTSTIQKFMNNMDIKYTPLYNSLQQ